MFECTLFIPNLLLFYFLFTSTSSSAHFFWLSHWLLFWIDFPITSHPMISVLQYPHFMWMSFSCAPFFYHLTSNEQCFTITTRHVNVLFMCPSITLCLLSYHLTSNEQCFKKNHTSCECTFRVPLHYVWCSICQSAD